MTMMWLCPSPWPRAPTPKSPWRCLSSTAGWLRNTWRSRRRSHCSPTGSKSSPSSLKSCDWWLDWSQAPHFPVECWDVVRVDVGCASYVLTWMFQCVLEYVFGVSVKCIVHYLIIMNWLYSNEWEECFWPKHSPFLMRRPQMRLRLLKDLFV